MTQVLALDSAEVLRSRIYELVAAVRPFDAVEEEQRAQVLEWIASGADLFRVHKPDVPPMHLVSYFVLLDEERGKILLVDHLKAGLWLPTGGHVEPGEHPTSTVEREILEELGVGAEWFSARREPIFLTSTLTRGDVGRHTDVSLWFVLRGNSERHLQWDQEEF